MIEWDLFGLFKRRTGFRTKFGMPNALSGAFELRVDRLDGWVKDAYGTDAAGMQIDVYRQGVVVASNSATAERKQGYFKFSIPIGGLFTGADLLRETVVLMASDSNGNKGRLRLDGAAQIELIREYLGAPADVILDLDFSGGGNASPYLGAGWYAAEADRTWTEGDDSFVSFVAPSEPGTYSLRMTTGALVINALTAQEMTVFINGNHIGYFISNQYNRQFHECKFSHDVFAGATAATLRIHHPDAARPLDLGSGLDGRRLALSFKRLMIVRLLPANDDVGVA